jgi:ribosomal protein S18 acetylase RimI-like enzyme
VAARAFVSAAGAPRPGGLVNALTLPSETRRLLTGWARALGPPDGPWDPVPADWIARGLSEGTLRGRLWVGPGGDEAVGLAAGAPPGEVGGRLEALHLDEGFAGPAALRGFLARLDVPEEFGPLVELPDLPPGEAGDAGRAVLRSLGFSAVPRVDMRYPPDRPVFPVLPTSEVRLRPITPADTEALAGLNARAYADNPVDVALFRVRRDLLTDARQHIAMLLGREIGPWLASGSFLVEDDVGVVGATIANERDGALVTQVMVDPRARRRGHAARLLAATIDGLRADGQSNIRLVVTLSNRRAERLYRSLGFAVDPKTQGVSWVHAERLGLTGADLAGT